MDPSSVIGTGPSMLYVEDEAEARELTGRALAEEHPQVSIHIAANGAEGLELFRRHRPDLVITDIKMPVMDGLQMTGEIKAIDPEVEVIALTAYSDTKFLLDAIELGFSQYVLKPVDFDRLFAAVDKSLKIVGHKRQVSEQNEKIREINAELEKLVAEARDSEQRLRATFDQVAVGIGHITLDGKFMRMNPRFCEITGCSPEEPMSVSMFDFTHHDDLPKCHEYHQRLLEGKLASYSLEKRYIHDDGSTVWTSLSVSSVTDAAGHPLFMVAVVDDITSRKQAEEDRERLLVQHEAILNSLHEGVIITDPKGRVLSMNPAALALHQHHSIEQARQLAHPYQDFEIILPYGDPVPFDHWPISRALRGERFTDYELCVIRNTGHEFIASYNGTPVMSADGREIMLAVVTMRDITARRQAVDALHKSEHKFATIFRSVPATIIISTVAEGNCIDINEAGLRMLGYRRDEIVGQNLPDLGVWENTETRGLLIEILVREEVVRDQEVRLRGRDNRAVTALLSLEQVHFDGEPYLLSIFTDITHRKELEEEVASLNAALAVRATELESANRDLEAFSYTIAHDLRKPLTVINGYCQILTELCGEHLDDECRGYIQAATEGTVRMDRLIDALLLFSSSSQVEPRREPVDLSATAESVAAELELAEPGRKVAFTIAPDINVEGDAHLLRVVIANLFGNAWKYTSDREEACIEFGVAERDGRRTFFVRDNGIGFSMDEGADIFAPFRRLPSGQRIGGLGIGLATVARIIKRHGGDVWAEAEPGKGATFYFTLP